MAIYQIIAPADRRQSAPVAATGLAGSEADALEAALADMTATFSANFVDGRIGERHNTYEHRTRVLRQMTGRLAAMRARDAAVTS
jgi:hypothetical protein